VDDGIGEHRLRVHQPAVARPTVGWAAVGWTAVGWAAVGWTAVGWTAVGWTAVGWAAFPVMARLLCHGRRRPATHVFALRIEAKPWLAGLRRP
jgi:hypothetical protein